MARLTVTETVRQPITLLLTGTCVWFIALLPALILHVMGDPDKLVRDSALATQFVGGLLLAAYAACAAVKHEIQRGTVATVLTKPVGRTLFFLAKFSGVAGVLLLYMLASGAATLLATRMVRESYVIDWWTGGPLWIGLGMAFALAGAANYFGGRPYSSTAFAMLLILLVAVCIGTSMLDVNGKPVAIGSFLQWKLMPAFVLITLALLVLAGLAVALATRLDTVATMSICSVVFLLGLMTDYLFGRAASDSTLAAVLYRLLPNWQHFWLTDALSGEPGQIPWVYVGRAAVYAAFYLAGVLCWGILAFRRMELR